MIRASGSVLTSSDMNAHNTFDQPNVVMPANLAVTISNQLLNVMIPTASVTKLDVVLLG